MQLLQRILTLVFHLLSHVFSYTSKKRTTNAFFIFLVLRRAFDTLDPNKKGIISADDLGTILDTLGQHQNDQVLKDLVASVDREGI